MTNVVVFSKYNLLKLAPTIIPLMEQGVPPSPCPPSMKMEKVSFITKNLPHISHRKSFRPLNNMGNVNVRVAFSYP